MIAQAIFETDVQKMKLNKGQLYIETGHPLYKTHNWGLMTSI